jgi:hypothetical protein
MDPFAIPTKMLKLLGMWQEESSPRWYRIYGALMHLYILEHSCFCQTVYAIMMIQHRDYKEFIETLSILLSCYLTIFKSLIFVKSVKSIQKLTMKLRDLLKFSDFNSKPRPRVEFYSTVITRISNFMYAFHFFICTLSILLPLIGKNKRLPFKTWVYFDYEKSDFSFMAIMVMESFISLLTTVINNSLDVYPVIFMCYAIAMLKELSIHFREVKCDDNKMKIPMKIRRTNVNKPQTKIIDLKTCVDLHVKLKDFCADISSTYALHFMVQGFFSTLLLCSSTFHLTKVGFLNN